MARRTQRGHRVISSRPWPLDRTTADHRKFVVTDVERSLDPLGLTKEIETVAANLGEASFSEIANQFNAFTAEG